MHSNLFGHILSFGTVFIWGVTYVSTKVLLQSFTPAEILLMRFILGYIALFILYPKISTVYHIKYEIFFILAGLTGIFLFLIFRDTALNYTLISNVSILANTSPFITVLLAYILLKDEKITHTFFVGMFMALCGAVVIILNGSFILKLNPLGDILAVLAATSWAIYSLLIKKISILNIHPIQSTRKIFFYGLLWTLPYLLWTGSNISIEKLLLPTNIFNLIFVGFGASALCFATWSYAVQLLGTVKTSIYMYFMPVMAVLSSIIILNETITLYSVIGIATIILSLIIANKKQ